MGSKDQSGFAVVGQLLKAIDGFLREFDACLLCGVMWVKVPQAIQVGKLRPNATKIVPTASQNGVDLAFRFFRESVEKIGSSNPVFRQQRPDPAAHPAGKISDPVRVDQAHALEHSDRNRSDQRLACTLEAAAQAPGYPPHGNTARSSRSPCRIPGGFRAAQ